MSALGKRLELETWSRNAAGRRQPTSRGRAAPHSAIKQPPEHAVFCSRLYTGTCNVSCPLLQRVDEQVQVCDYGSSLLDRILRYLNLPWCQTHNARLASYEISAALAAAELQVANAAADKEAAAEREATSMPGIDVSYVFFWNDEIYTKGNFLIVA